MCHAKCWARGLLGVVALAGCTAGDKLDSTQDGVVTTLTLSLEDVGDTTLDFTVEQPAAGNDFTVRYPVAARYTPALRTIKVANPAGLTLWFVVAADETSIGSSSGRRAPLGARLLRAQYDDGRHGPRELLYRNTAVTLSRNWGPCRLGAPLSPNGDCAAADVLGWPGVGGVERAFPVHEHGYYAAVDWSYRFGRVGADGDFAFTAIYQPPAGLTDRRALAVEITTTVPARGAYWKTSVRLQNLAATAQSYEYWDNLMLPAGSESVPDDVEVLMPEATRIEVHSTGDPRLGGPRTLWPWIAGDFKAHIHGPADGAHVTGWLGLFDASGTLGNADPLDRVSRFAMFNHTRVLGLGVAAATGERAIYPKAFAGPGIGSTNWTQAAGRYVELWTSPTSRAFWPDSYATLAAGATRADETLSFPMVAPSDLADFPVHAPATYTPGAGDPGDFAASLIAAAEASQLIRFNPGAALQKQIFAHGFVPNSNEVTFVAPGRRYQVQRGEHLVSGQVRAYYAAPDAGGVWRVAYLVRGSVSCSDATCWERDLMALAEAAQLIRFNPGAALQKRIFADGFSPNSNELDFDFPPTGATRHYVAQRGEHLATGEVRAYFVEKPLWDRVSYVKRP